MLGVGVDVFVVVQVDREAFCGVAEGEGGFVVVGERIHAAVFADSRGEDGFARGVMGGDEAVDRWEGADVSHCAEDEKISG